MQIFLKVLKEFYKVKEDWKEKIYCGIVLDSNYNKCYVNIAMPNYVQKQLIKYK